MTTRIIRTIVPVLLVSTVVAAEPYDRVDHEHLVDPVASSYLGGPGTEWLTGGGFQPDGSLVLSGVTIGPTFSIGNAKATVLGTDQPAPAAQEWPIQRDGKGNPRRNRDGSIKLGKFGYDNPAATPFVVQLDADLKTVRNVVRLPWTAGTVTGTVVDASGAVYLAGFGNAELLRTTCDDVAPVTPPEVEFGKNPPRVRTGYLAKLVPDLSRIEWIRTLEARLDFPRLELTKKGRVLYRGLAFDTFDASGRRVARVELSRGLNPKHYAVNEATGEIAYGHEHHWPTGREPWRCPELRLFNADGSVKYHLYDWPGPVVGSDASRLVSDSAIRTITYTPDGKLLFSAWSDGGNSVMYNQPFDLRLKAWDGRNTGLRLSAAGAGAMSFAYVIRMDPGTCNVDRGTLWTSQYKGVESARVNAILPTSDGSVAIAGSVYGHLYATPNQFEAGDQMGGANLTILNPNLDGLRFSSYVPGGGAAELGNRAQFQLFRGEVDGRERLVAVSGAVDHEYAPRLEAAHSAFGGGHLDGHFVVLDMTP